MLSSDHLARLAAVGITTAEQIIVVTTLMEEASRDASRDAADRHVTHHVTLSAMRAQAAERSRKYRLSKKGSSRDASRDGGIIGGKDLSTLKISQEKKEKESKEVTNAREGSKPTNLIDKPKKKPLTHLAPDWRPNAHGWAKAITVTGSEAEAENQLVLFHAHHTAHAKLMANWDMAWITWLGNYPTFNRKGNGNGGQTSVIGHNQRVLAEAKRREASYAIRSREGTGRDLFFVQGRSETDD